MSALSEEMAALALELINEFGGAVLIEYENRNKVYDPNTGTYSAGDAIADATPKALIEDKGLWLGTAVMGEKKITLATTGLTKPEPGDKFTVVGEQFTVMQKGVVAYYVGLTPVLYEVYGVK